MQIKEAIVLRLQQLCEKQDITYNAMAMRAGVTPSTVYSMMDRRRKDLSVVTLKKLCDGLDISIRDFFDDELFKELEQELV
ncbi:MAG: helix-turn-helix domain-containing protein [Christensenellales bacterium]|jgi:transcriptional regulator with XRE-family HTH domain